MRTLKRLDRLRTLYRSNNPASAGCSPISKRQSAKAQLARDDSCAAVAELAGLNTVSRASAFARAALLSLRKKNYAKARALGERALVAADQVKEEKYSKQVRQIKANAAWTVALAAKELKQGADARRYQDVARRFGNQNARRLTL